MVVCISGDGGVYQWGIVVCINGEDSNGYKRYNGEDFVYLSPVWCYLTDFIWRWLTLTGTPVWVSLQDPPWRSHLSHPAVCWAVTSPSKSKFLHQLHLKLLCALIQLAVNASICYFRSADEAISNHLKDWLIWQHVSRYEYEYCSSKHTVSYNCLSSFVSSTS